MTSPEAHRHELYTGLTQVLGPDLTERLMSYLPVSPGVDVATRTDITQLRDEIGDLRTELRSEMGDLRTELRSEMGDLRTELRSEMAGLRDGVHRDIAALGQRIDRLQLTLIAGFFAVVATLVATGLLG